MLKVKKVSVEQGSEEMRLDSEDAT